MSGGGGVSNFTFMFYNLNAGYGNIGASANDNFTFGKTFYVVGATFPAISTNNYLYREDPEGVVRFFSGSTAVTDALARTVAGRNDQILIDSSYSTPLTATELLTAETNGVNIIPVGKRLEDGAMFATRATGTLPATTTGSLFTVTGRVKLLSIIGEVTTATGATATNGKLIATPTV